MCNLFSYTDTVQLCGWCQQLNSMYSAEDSHHNIKIKKYEWIECRRHVRTTSWLLEHVSFLQPANSSHFPPLLVMETHHRKEFPNTGHYDEYSSIKGSSDGKSKYQVKQITFEYHDHVVFFCRLLRTTARGNNKCWARHRNVERFLCPQNEFTVLCTLAQRGNRGEVSLPARLLPERNQLFN